MIETDAITVAAAALAETRDYCRIEGSGEDIALARLIAVAIGHGEAFTGRLWLARTVHETVPACADWTRLGATPVRSVDSVEEIVGIGAPTALAGDAYAIDIDAAGDGWLRIAAAGGASRIALTYQAGIAGEWEGLPEPLRQGAVRLASHLYAHRDAADEGAPPAAVAALWRPWRRMRLA